MTHAPTHLEPETIERLIHEELSEGQRSAALNHVESCASCRRLLEASMAEDEEVFALIATVEPPLPPITAADVLAQGASRNKRIWGRWAAAALLTLVGVGTAYAAPGSPIPEWLEGAFGGDSGAVMRPAPEPLPDEEAGSGIMVDLAGDWTIDFPDPPSNGVIEVTIQEGPNISIRSSDVGSSFDWDVERVTVHPGDAARADFSINVPPAAASVEIVVRERTVWRRAGRESVTTSMDEVEAGVFQLRLGDVHR